MIKTSRAGSPTGKVAEDIAANYLLKQNLSLIERNFHCRFGEIDLIALEQEILVFIEVRYRENERYLNAIETVDKHKCRKIITTSEYFLNKNKRYRNSQCRFDVVTITDTLDKPVIRWIKNAFQA